MTEHKGKVKQTMIRKIIWALLLLGLTLTAQAEPAVGFSAANIQTQVGKTFTTEIVISGFPATEGGGISLTFDPGVLQVLSVTMNSAVWNFATQPGVIDNANGVITDLWFSSFSGVTGDASVATVRFKALAQGSSTLAMAELSTSPFASAGERVSPGFASSSVSVAKKANLGGCGGGCHQ